MTAHLIRSEPRPRRHCCVRWLGRVAYEDAWRMQRDLARARLQGAMPDTLLLLEHPPTITIGRRGAGDHILADPELLGRLGIAVVHSDRGGDVTYHGPGQLVGYPILKLDEPPHRPDVRGYMRDLEEVIIRALAGWGIRADRAPGYTGVWIDADTQGPAKIAALGVRISRWVTMHGFALNVGANLAPFDLIVPCGIRDRAVTSMSAVLARDVTVEQVVQPIVAAFAEVTGVDGRWGA